MSSRTRLILERAIRLAEEVKNKDIEIPPSCSESSYLHTLEASIAIENTPQLKETGTSYFVKNAKNDPLQEEEINFEWQTEPYQEIGRKFSIGNSIEDFEVDFDSDDSVKDKNYIPDDDNELSESGEANISLNSSNFDDQNFPNVDNNIENVAGNNNLEAVIEAEAEAENFQIKNKSRKRVRNEKSWKRNEKKKKVNCGEAYVSEGKRNISAKAVKPPCKMCRFKCVANFTPDERKTIHTNYWKLGDNALHRQYVAGHMEVLKPKYRRVTEGSTRSANISYFLTKGGGIKKPVCKKFFMHTLDVRDKFIRTTWAKAKDTNAMIERDRRGNYNKIETISLAVKDGIRNHINSFARIESHYLRAQTEREFIDGSLTIAQMYRFYKEEQEQKKLPAAKKSMYEKIFNTEFNISFFVPKKDQCATCEASKNSSEEEKRNSKESYESHIACKNRAREEKHADVAKAKDDSGLKVAVFDLQAVLPTPSGEISTYYYKCRLNCYNFTIYDIPTKSGVCYFWHEAIARRGANDIGSCLLNYLQGYCDNKKVIFYSDNCTGQQKNKFILSMYLYAVSNFNIESISHKFLTTGHTQNEGDSMHSCIERQKKRALRSGPIYVPAQWTPIIRLAKKGGNPYYVKEMATDDFFDFKLLNEQIGKNFSVNIKGEKVTWAEIKEIKVNKNCPNKFFYKSNFDTDYEEVDINLKTRRGHRITRIADLKLEMAYKEPPAVSDKTKKHLVELCKQNLIEKIHHPYYENLLSCKISNAVDNTDNNEDEN